MACVCLYLWRTLSAAESVRISTEEERGSGIEATSPHSMNACFSDLQTRVRIDRSKEVPRRPLVNARRWHRSAQSAESMLSTNPIQSSTKANELRRKTARASMEGSLCVLTTPRLVTEKSEDFRDVPQSYKILSLVSRMSFDRRFSNTPRKKREEKDKWQCRNKGICR